MSPGMPSNGRMVVGLGNPGPEYDGTRHNVGFDVIDRLASKTSIPVELFGSNALSGMGSYRGRKVLLAKPTTYVNRSGAAVRALLSKHGLTPDQLLVVVDDINLPVGRVRLRPGGGAGGHNGLEDLIDSLQSSDFARLRIGVGNNFSRGRQADYVLSRFESDEEPIMEEAFEKSVDAVLMFVREGIDRAMNEANRG